MIMDVDERELFVSDEGEHYFAPSVRIDPCGCCSSTVEINSENKELVLRHLTETISYVKQISEIYGITWEEMKDWRAVGRKYWSKER